MEIHIPTLNWFLNSLPKKPGASNPFFGSFGTSPTKGIMNCKTFSFKVYLKKLEDESLEFIAESYILQPWSVCSGIEKTDEYTEQFPGTEESIAQIESSLLLRARQLL